MNTKEKFTKTSLESFKKLRSLTVDGPEWISLRNQICEENQRLAYYAVHKAGRGCLTKFTAGMRETILNDLRQVAVAELLRVITAYDPERPHPKNPDKHVEFATFAFKNLVFKIRDKCKEIEEHIDRDITSDPDDDDLNASILDKLPAPLSYEEEEQLGTEKRMEILSRISDPSLTPRLASILNKLKFGDNVTLFERQFLFKLIADPNVVLSPGELAGSEAFLVSKSHEPTSLRRYRSWRQILS